MARAFVWLLVAAGIAALGWSAYQTGTVLAESRVTELTARVSELTAQRDGARTDNGRLQAALAEQRQAIATLQTRYDADVPKGDLAQLFALTRDRLAQNVPADRLAQLLREAAPVRPCDTRIVRKRFAIQAAGRPEEAASLLEGMIQVTATIPTAGADPARSAVIAVSRAWAAEPLKLTGLPAKQDIAVNNVVLHLTVEASDVAGFASASLSSCGRG